MTQIMSQDPPLCQNMGMRLTVGERAADALAARVGSWPFILTQSVLIVAWVGINLCWHAWDQYPFILLNLMLSFQAAYTGPIVLMSQNRLAAEDRAVQRRDYEVDERAEEEIREILERLERIETLLLKGAAE